MGLQLSPLSEPEWTRAIAAVIDGRGVVRGTAFFVGPDVALTCHHVLTAASMKPLTLRQVGSFNAETVIGEDCDEELDLALVRVPSRADRSRATLSPGMAMIGHSIYSRGFPRDYDLLKYPDGFPMDPARISGLTTLVWRGQPIRMLVLVDADVQKGMSGAPAVDIADNSVVGILRFSEEGKERALAVPAEVATRRWPRLALGPDQPAQSFEDLTRAFPETLARSVWDQFDPSLFHCVVIGSETLASGDGGDALVTLAREVLSSPKAKALWSSFATAWKGRQLVRGRQGRRLAAQYTKTNVKLAWFDVLDAYASPASLDLAIRLLVEADLALFDVTRFEPGVMLLLGVRAATRRGVTIASHGGGWREGEPLARPFNLSDLSLSSHSPPTDAFVGDDPRLDRFVERVVTGFDQLARQPYYRDLPVYDALRQLGHEEKVWTSIPLDEEVLVLCSYDPKYFPMWQNLRRQLRNALSEEGILTNVARLQDVATPQVVSQSLYERIRRCAGCVADWTGSSPSTFFELGVRMTVSPWSVVQIASEEWLQDVISSGGANSMGGQLKLMQSLLDPLLYKSTSDAHIGSRIAHELLEMRRRGAGSPGHRVRQVAAEALGRTEDRLPDLFEQLRREANALSHQSSIRDNVPQTLFYEVTDIKTDQERSALERRIAAWLYLEHRIGASSLPDSDERKKLWRELGEVVAADLFASINEADQALAQNIDEKLT